MAKKQMEQTEIEAPYELPEGWKWVRLDFLLTEVKNGTTIKQSKNIDGPKVTRIESLQNQTIDFNRLGVIINESEIKENDWYIADDIALSHINSAEHVGKTALITSDMLPLVHGMNLLRLRFVNNFYPKLFHFYSQSFQYKVYIQNHMNMAVNQVSINQKQVSSIPFPLPPTLDEQQRIVNRIETLFAKLDEAKEKVQNVVDTFETRKASILHKAFTGELTKKWREENGVGDDSWEEKTVGECCFSLKYGTSSKSESYGKIAVIRMGNLQKGEIIYDDLVYSNNEEDIRKYKLSKYDVLFNRTNSPEWVGKTSIYRGDIPAIYAGYLIKLDYDHEILNGCFLNFILNTPEAKDYCNSVKTDGVNQSNINAQKIGAFKIPVPSLLEQQEIVRILDIVFEKENQAKEAAIAVLEQIDLLKKSILARAFRGKL